MPTPSAGVRAWTIGALSGELPELAALMRRPRDGRSLRPGRSRAPALGAPQGARTSMMPLEGDEFDDDGAEPTRIADMSGPNSPLSAGMAAAAMRSAPGASSSPKHAGLCADALAYAGSCARCRGARACARHTSARARQASPRVLP